MEHQNDATKRRALHRRLPNGARNLKARFSPTAILPTTSPVPITLPNPLSSIIKSILDPPVSVTSAVVTPVKSVITTPSAIVPASTSTLIVTPSLAPTAPTTTPIPTVLSTTTSAIPTKPTVVKTTVPAVTTPAFTRTVATITSSAPSAATSTGAPSSGVHAGAIVGGVAGALVGIAALLLVVSYVMRRWLKRGDSDEGLNFDPSNFRRSAVMIDDPPTHDGNSAHGYGARPPSMIERHVRNVGGASTPVSYTSNPFNGPHETEYDNAQYASYPQQQHASYGYQGAGPMAYQNYGTGEDMRSPTASSHPNGQALFSPTTGAPAFTTAPALFSPSAYGPSPFTPLPVGMAAASTSDHAGPASFINRATPVAPSVPAKDTNYVALDRATTAPVINEKQRMRVVNEEVEDAAPAYTESPFADPSSGSLSENTRPRPPRALSTARGSDVSFPSPYSLPTSAGLQAPAPLRLGTALTPPSPLNHTGHSSEMFFEPPSTPAAAASSSATGRARVDSKPPMLPELPREFSPVFNGGDNTPVAPQHKPSPLSSSGHAHDEDEMSSNTSLGSLANTDARTRRHSPLSGAGMSYPTSAVVGDDVIAAPAPVARARGGEEVERKRPDTVYTVYDPEDAYGGF